MVAASTTRSHSDPSLNANRSQPIVSDHMHMMARMARTFQIDQKHAKRAREKDSKNVPGSGGSPQAGCKESLIMTPGGGCTLELLTDQDSGAEVVLGYMNFSKRGCCAFKKVAQYVQKLICTDL